MRFARRLLPWIVAGAATLSLPGQTVIGPTYTYDISDGLVQWDFTLDEQTFSGSVTHIVIGYDGPDGFAPPVSWDGVTNVVIQTSSHGVTKVDVWPDSTPGRSYLELDFNTPFSLDGNSSTFTFSFLTSGILNLGNAGSVNFFVEFRNGTATQNVALDGALVAMNSMSGTPGNLTAIPEPATCALLAGVAMLGAVALRRRRHAA